MTKWIHDSLKIRGKDIPIKIGEMLVADLKFFVENPRIYSVVWSEGDVPDQDEIYKTLKKFDNVKVLKEDIRLNDGLLEAIIVQDGTFEVLEGNRRLAAYRMLSETDPIKWGKIKVWLLPKDVAEEDVFALLGQYHIKGRADWSPYEQAGFLYRRYKKHNISKTDLAKEIGLGAARVGTLINTYELMQKHKVHDVDKWSYFEVYKSSKGIREVAKTLPQIEERFVSDVKTGKITQAVDVREKMGKLDKAPARAVKAYVNGNMSLEAAYERAVNSGGTNELFNRLQRFREWIIQPAVLADAKEADDAAVKKIDFELKKIERRLEQVRKAIGTLK
jgi:hypothetical protein